MKKKIIYLLIILIFLISNIAILNVMTEINYTRYIEYLLENSPSTTEDDDMVIFKIDNNCNYQISKLSYGLVKEEFKFVKTLKLEEKIIVLDIDYLPVVKIGDIISKGDIYATNSSGNNSIADAKMRFIQINNKQDCKEYIFQVLENHSFVIDLVGINYIDIELIEAKYLDIFGNEISLNIHNEIFINENYIPQVMLEGFIFDDKTINGLEYEIILTTYEKLDCFSINEDYLFYDEEIDKYYLKKTVFSAALGSCYIKEYIEQFYIEYGICYIKDDLNEYATYTNYLY